MKRKRMEETNEERERERERERVVVVVVVVAEERRRGGKLTRKQEMHERRGRREGKGKQILIKVEDGRKGEREEGRKGEKEKRMKNEWKVGGI